MSITPVYHISDYLDLCNELTKWETRYEYVKRSVARDGKIPSKRFFGCLRSICHPGKMESEEMCLRYVQAARQKISSYEAVSSIGERSGTAFVTFRTPLDARMVARMMSSSYLEFMWIQAKRLVGLKSKRVFNNRVISANMAPQPDDIFWENLDVSKSKRLRLKLVTASMTIIVLILAFGVLYGMSEWKIYLSNQAAASKDHSSLALHIAPFLPSLFIIVVNISLEKILLYLASYEQHYSWTKYNKSVSEKLIISEALNTSFLPFLVSINPRDKWFMSGGLIDDIFLQIVTMSILSPILYFFNVERVTKTYRRWRLSHRIPTGKCSLSQLACNRTFENIEMDFPQLYIRLTNQLILAFIYAPVIPLGVPITLLGFLVEYIVDKYMLLRVHCRPKAQNAMIAEYLSKAVPITMMLYALGAIVFFVTLKADRTYGCVAAMGALAVGFYVFPTSAMFQGVLKAHETDVMKEMLEQMKANEYLYEKKAASLFTVSFTQDYKRENPMTADEGFKDWLKLIAANSTDPSQQLLATEMLAGSPDLTLGGRLHLEKMRNYSSKHQTLPEKASYLHGVNSDSRDETLDPGIYSAVRMDRLRDVFARSPVFSSVLAAQIPIMEEPELGQDSEADRSVGEERQPQARPVPSHFEAHLPFYQNPYSNQTRRVMNEVTLERLNSPMMRRLTTLMDVETSPGVLVDGELPDVPVSTVQNQRLFKIPFEPEHNFPYSFAVRDWDERFWDNLNSH